MHALDFEARPLSVLVRDMVYLMLVMSTSSKRPVVISAACRRPARALEQWQISLRQDDNEKQKASH